MTLTLFSWLTPLLALIVLGFLISFPFVSLVSFWRSHFATGLLLSAAIAMIFLINCCYQDGVAEQPTSILRKFGIKRLGGTLGSIELVPLVGLSAWGLSLRVGQYGWSVERITAAAVILIVSCYALGYATALIRSPFWLRRLETTNWIGAYVGLAVFLALFSPVADPARLMVADQMRRLRAGVAPPDSFDLVALKFDGARWGATALNDLRHGAMASNAIFQSRLEKVLAAQNRYWVEFSPSKATLQQWADAVTVYPAGKSLPASLMEPYFAVHNGISLAFCTGTRGSATSCFARYVTLHPGQPAAVVFVAAYNGSVFEQDSDRHWQRTGVLTGSMGCLQDLRSGVFSLEPRTTPDLVVEGQRITITLLDPVAHACSAKTPPD